MRRRLYLGSYPTGNTRDSGVKLRVEEEDGRVVYGTRDQSEGERIGSHPGSCTCSQDSSGVLAVKDETGKAICYYEPGEFQVVGDEESGLLHIHRTGEWSLEKAQQLEPKEMEEAEDSRFAREDEDARPQCEHAGGLEGAE